MLLAKESYLLTSRRGHRVAIRSVPQIYHRPDLSEWTGNETIFRESLDYRSTVNRSPQHRDVYLASYSVK